MAMKRTSPKTRFWGKVQVGSENAARCWIWIGATNGKYGIVGSGMGRNSSPVYAHRLSYKMHTGKIPAGGLILHTCDNTLCVNPNHLYLGTQRDNMRDCVRRGRHKSGARFVRKGASNVNAKLTQKEVDELRVLRAMGVSLNDLAGEFEIAFQTVSKIARGDRYKQPREQEWPT